MAIARFLVIVLFCCIKLFSSSSLKAAPNKYAAIVIDARNGTILHDKFSTKKRYPASLTKIMTLYLLFEDLESKKVKLSTRMKISKKAAGRPPTKLGLKAGQKISVKDALLGLMIKSANDAAVVIAEHLEGSEKAFATRMTRKAKKLGMKKTIFKNCHGLPNKDQQTTAKDMATLGRALFKRFPAYYRYVSTQSFWYQGRKFKNHNRLLGKVKGVDGIKTGYINASGFNLVTSAVREGIRLIAVVMGGRSSQARDRRMAQLLEVTFKKILADQRLFLARLTPPKKPFNFSKPYLLMAKGPQITPPPLPDCKLPEVLPPVGPTFMAQKNMSPTPSASHPPLRLASNSTTLGSGSTLDSDNKDSDDKSLKSTHRSSREWTLKDLIGDKIRSLDPIGDKIRRLESRATLPHHNPDWSVQVGAFSLAKDAHSIAVEHLSRLSPSYEATVSVTLSKLKRRNLYQARLSGLTEREAHQICTELKNQGQRCLPIKPHRDPTILSAHNTHNSG